MEFLFCWIFVDRPLLIVNFHSLRSRPVFPSIINYGKALTFTVVTWVFTILLSRFSIDPNSPLGQFSLGFTQTTLKVLTEQTKQHNISFRLICDETFDTLNQAPFSFLFLPRTSPLLVSTWSSTLAQWAEIISEEHSVTGSPTFFRLAHVNEDATCLV